MYQNIEKRINSLNLMVFSIFLFSILGLIEPVIYKFNLKSIYMLIYILTVPTIIFFLGYVLQNLEIKDIFKGTIVTYLLCQCSYFLISYILKIEIIDFSFVRPINSLWIFVSLFFWIMVTPFIYNKKYCVLISFILPIVVGFDHNIGEILGLSTTLSYFPFFLLGYSMRNGKLNFEFQDSKLLKKILMVLSIVTILAGFLLSYKIDINDMFLKYSYSDLNNYILPSYIIRLIIILVSMAAVYIFINIFRKTINNKVNIENCYKTFLVQSFIVYTANTMKLYTFGDNFFMFIIYILLMEMIIHFANSITIPKVKYVLKRIMDMNLALKLCILIFSILFVTFMIYLLLNGISIWEFNANYIKANSYNVVTEITCIFFLILFFYLVVYDIKVKNNKNLIVIMRTALIIAIVSAFIMQFLQLGLFIDSTFTWIVEKYRIFLVNILILFFVYMGLISLTSLYWGAAIGFLVIFLISLANFLKINILGQPLYPIDFYQIKNFDSLLTYIGGNIFLIILICLFVVLGMIFLSRRFKKYKLQRIYILITISLTIAIVLNCISPTDINAQNLYTMAGANYVAWDQMWNYKDNGTLYAMLSNLDTSTMDKPENYNADKINSIIAEYTEKANEYNSRLKSSTQKPNIIYIMSESFWDPSKLSFVDFSDDPIKNIRKGMDENYHLGEMLSPSFGGSTSNVEYEALTGFSNYFLKDGSVPYQQSINKDFPSIVEMLKNDGYNAYAVHPYFTAPYKRSYVYNNFGFDAFIGEDDMKYNDKLSGDAYVSDYSLMNEIKDILNENSEPTFIHAVSMQNHMGYYWGKNGEESIEVTDNNLSSDTRDPLKIYTEGIKQSDLAIKELLDYVEKLNEPTIVIYFGDHLPYFAKNEDILDSDFMQGKSPEEREKFLSETPMLFYSNFDTEDINYNTLGSNFISLKTFEALNKEISPYYAMLQDVKQEFDGLKKNLILDSKGNIVNDLTEIQKTILDKYSLIQYDITEGKRYSLKTFFSVQN